MEKDPKETWIIPATAHHLPDGSTLIKPGKAIQRATAARTSKVTGVHRLTLSALADCGLIDRERPSPGQSFYFPGQVEELLRKTREDPAFWNSVRTKAYISGESLAKSRPK